MTAILFSTQLLAENFTRYLEKHTPSIIKIFNKDNLHINENCFKNFIECKNYFQKNANSKKMITKTSNLIGHPAGQFCINSNGTPEIFYDVKNNQYDFCNFNEKYIVDSWDFYNRFNK